MCRGPVLLVSIVLVAVVLGASLLLTGGNDAALDAGATPEGTGSPDGERESATLADGGTAVHGREEVGGPGDAEPRPDEGAANVAVPRAPEPGTAAEVVLRGRVLDVRGAALGGVGVGTRKGQGPLAESDGTGAFAFPVDAGFTGRIEVVGKGFATLCAARVHAGDLGREQLVVAAHELAADVQAARVCVCPADAPCRGRVDGGAAHAQEGPDGGDLPHPVHLPGPAADAV